MNLLTKAIEKKLRDNYATNLAHRNANEGATIDFKPVVKMFNPCGAATWLFTELDEDNCFFGLCDLGMGCAELGYVSLDELKSIRLSFGLGIERDLHFTPKMTLKEYAEDSYEKGRIDA